MYYEFYDDHPKRKEMIVKVALYFNLITEEQLCEMERERVSPIPPEVLQKGESEKRFYLLPFDIKRMYLYFSYRELIRPLVNYDRIKKGLSFQKIADRYGVSKHGVEYMMKGR